jgi:hypothetical protein
MLRSVAEEIDMMFIQFGLADKVPKEARYAIMIAITSLPVLLLCCFFWCLPDDDYEVPSQPKAKAAQKVEEKVAVETPKEGSVSPDKKKKNKIE